MAKEKIYSGITEQLWECIKLTTEADHKTLYKSGNPGTVNVETVVGEIIFEFKFDASAKNLHYKIVKKPFLATEGQIWDTLDKSINKCLPK